MKKKTKKTSKATKKTTKAKTAKMSSIKNGKQSIIQPIETFDAANKLPLDENRMPYEDVEDLFFTLDRIFHPEGIDDNGPNSIMMSLWTLFLVSVNWTESEFWEEFDASIEKCDDCKKKDEEDKKLIAIEKAKNIN